MRILFAASYNKGYFAPFILEQAEALRRAGAEVDIFGISGKGIRGYIAALPALKRKISEFRPDVIHAHYGLTGLLANLQRRIPVVTTFHGSDINERKVLLFSKLAMCLSRFNIFVSPATIEIAGPKKNFELIPCGIDLSDLQLTDRSEARQRLGLKEDGRYILFAGAFDNRVKNAPLAQEAAGLVQGAELIELKGYKREEVTLLMCACNALMLTSFTEGSPQVVKEALACGCPVVSVDVGDVRELISGIEGCYITTREAKDIADALELALSHAGKTGGRSRIIEKGLTNDLIAGKLAAIYNSIR